MSAGIAAMLGSRASTHAVQAMDELGMDISGHESQPLTAQLVKQADAIFTMTSAHRAAILANWPDAADRVMPLCINEQDVSDPIGGTPELYKTCADQIKSAIEQRADDMGL